jgi:hypothetical protein
MTHNFIQSPLVVIGAGRSGSTLISRILGAHSAIDFKGETSFLLLRLWVEVWHDRFWLNWPRHVATGPRCAADPLPPMSPQQLAAERARVGALVAELLVGLLRVEREDHRIWGYKELWSGLAQYNHDWSAYDAVLPEARWLHLVRHPFDFARSCATWNGTRLTPGYLQDRLSNWVDMLACHRKRKETTRYHEIRLEDLTRDPQGSLSPVLEMIGLRWQPAMGRVLNARTMSSQHADGDDGVSLTQDDAEGLIAQVPGLSAAMSSCGYLPPEHTPLSTDSRPESVIDLRNPEREGTGSYPPRHALEAQLHEARSSVARLAECLSEDLLDVRPSSNTKLTESFREVRSILARLTDALKQ